MKPIKSLLFLFFMNTVLFNAWPQNTDKDMAVIKKAADNILEEAEFTFRGKENDQIYASAQDIPEDVEVEFACNYGGWHYSSGVLNMAMMNLFEFLKEDKYRDFTRQHLAFGFENYKYFEKRYTGDEIYYYYPFGQFFTMSELDDYGAMGASIMDIYASDMPDEYKKYLENAAVHITEKQERFPDGTLVRAFPYEMTLWADDLYMSVPFLARLGKFTGEWKYYDDAIQQVLNFTSYLWDPDKQLYYHCYYGDTGQNGVAHWGRCNGWMIMAHVHLLEFLPDDHPQKDEIRYSLERQIRGIAKYQNGEGLWYQLLDKPDSYTESSASAMFVYAIAKAVNEGWIDDRYASIAVHGWDGLVKHKVTDDGRLKDICVGTGIQQDMVFYYNRPAKTNEKHGLGPFIDAGIEVIKLKQAYDSKE